MGKPALKGNNKLELSAQDLLTSSPITVAPDDSLEMAVLLMSKHEIRHLPVVEGQNLVGMLSDRDIRESLPSYSEILAKPDVARTRFETKLSTLMLPGLITVEPRTPLVEIVNIFIEQKIGALPVVAPGTTKLVGIISYIDVLCAIRGCLK